MSNNLDEMLKEAPTLTFEPFQEEKQEIAEVCQEQPKEEETIEISLTAQEQEMVNSFAEQMI